MAMKLVDAEQLEADLTSVADKIRAKTGGEDALAFPSGFVSAVDSIASGGGADEALAEVEYTLTNGYTEYNNMFSYRSENIEVPTEILRNISKGKTFHQMFYWYRNPTIPSLDTSSGEEFPSMFEYCRATKIEGINITNATSISRMFAYAKQLTDIIFNGVIKITDLDLSFCILLTHDSLMSALNALYDWASEGSTSTYTLILGSTNLAKLTDAEKAIATQRGWTLA